MNGNNGNGGKKYLNYAIFLGIVLVVVLLAVNHSRHMAYLVDTMAGNDRAIRISSARELVQSEQFMDAVTGESITKRVRTVQALEDWANEPVPPKPPAPPKNPDGTQPEAPKVWGPADAVTQLVAYLKDPDKPVRDRVTIALIHVGTLNDDNLTSLSNGIKDGDAGVRKTIVRVLQILGQKDDAAAAPLIPEDLLPRIFSPTPDTTTAASMLRASRKPEIAATIVPKVVALIKADANARGVGGDVLGALPAQREESVQALLPQLKDSDEAVRTGAADALGKVGSKSAIPALKKAMAEDTAGVRRVAIGSIALIADPSGEDSLIEALNNPNDDNEARAQAAVGLGKIATPQAIAVLIKALGDFDLKVQLAAASGLARAGKPAIPSLLATLQSPNTDLRELASRALGDIASPEANPGLIAALRSGSTGARVAAADALGFSGNTGAVDALIGMLGDKDGAVATAAANALAQIGEPARAKLAQALSSGNPDVAYFAARALGQQGTGAVPAVKQAVATSAPSRRWATIALGTIGGPEATTVLQQLRQTGDPTTRESATQALKQIGAD